MPRFGLGVWRVPADDTARVVRTALEAGYRHVDTAQMYRNEAGVGQGLRDAGVARADVWITTKVAGARTADDAVRSLDESLERLGTDHVDLYLVHAPGPDGDVAVWRGLQALRADGRARAIGVSNFHPRLLDRLVDETGVVPAVNQIKLHPREPRRALVCHHRRHGIVTQSWAPLAEGRLLDHPRVLAVARRRGATPAQVLIRWHLQHGYVVFPKSITPGRIRENIGALDVLLTAGDMAHIDAIGRFDEPRRYWRGVVRRVRRLMRPG